MQTVTGSPETGDFAVELDFIPRLNLAVQQNSITFIHRIKLLNRTGRDFTGCECTLSAEPGFIREKTFRIEKIRTGESTVITEPQTVPDYDLLAATADSFRGNLILTVSCENETLCRETFSCEVFAPDQWLGREVMPELLAAFVTPNVEIISRLLHDTAAELERATGSSAIQGYQADKSRVYEICAAIYRAIRSRGINYSNPASSFGQPGQRIRFADTIIQHQLGTCLDLALLFAAVMEACGLHPVIIFNEGHAYIGCHLVERYFSDLPMDDLQYLRKLAGMDEFLVLETTMVTGETTFARAEEFAKNTHLAPGCEFQYAVDIYRARLSGVRPLPLKRSVNGMEFHLPETPEKTPDDTASRHLAEEVELLPDQGSAVSRIDRWSKKLLDLSLRNRLLNVRDTRQIIPVICPDIGKLEDALAGGAALSLNSISELLSEKDLHDMAAAPDGIAAQPIIAEEFASGRLRTFLSVSELSKRLTALYRQGKSDLEESGVNTVFLAAGFLQWQPPGNDSRTALAPILLIPVTLQRRSLAEGIRITRQDGETVINETLLEMLRTQFALNIPGLSPLPQDDSGVDAAKIMQIFRRAVRDMRGWEVLEEVKLGTFSFGKFVMWTDMTRQLDILQRHPLIRHLISGGGSYDDGVELFEPEKVASHLDPAELFCPLSADSSQLAAVLYSALGKNFVLHGPPGTGKSQTITNIIAHNLALGKRVLFVSEKKAALDVVHRRLTKIGLKPFCLELHSNKSGKAEVLAQFNEALQTADAVPPANWRKTTDELEKLRRELDDYVTELHSCGVSGYSAYDCFTYLLKNDNNELPGDWYLHWDLENTPHDRCDAIRQEFLLLAQAYRMIPEQFRDLTGKLCIAQWSPEIQLGMEKYTGEMQEAVKNTEDAFTAAAEPWGLQHIREVGTIGKVVQFLTSLRELPDLPETFFTADFPEKLPFITAFAALGKVRDELAEKLQGYRTESFKDYDFPGIARRLKANNRASLPVRTVKNFLLCRELAPLKKAGGGSFTAAALETFLNDAVKFTELTKKYAADEKEAAAIWPELQKEGVRDWEKISSLADCAGKVHAALAEITGSDRDLHLTVLEKCRHFMPQITRISRDFAGVDHLAETLEILKKKITVFSAFSVSPGRDLDSFRNFAGHLRDALPSLRDIMRYLDILDKVNILERNHFLEALEKQLPANYDPEKFFDTLFFRTLLRQISRHSSTLSYFHGQFRNDQIQQFCDLDRKYMDLTCKMIFARLAADLPRRRGGHCPDGTELGILKHECEKKSRHKPVRMLLEQIPNLYPKLKPCFLMSPLSVAQYLPPDSEPFDLIVFDEASQIPVWDAIGVIARGRQLIVVGDPKQMPPTDFFRKTDSAADDAGENDITDLESILDECLASGMYSAYLKWHYRSRHESLIAFSNHHYYDDRLFTFPAAKESSSLGVRMEFVPGGVYDHSASRTNPMEAAALVAYIFDRLTTAGDRRSLGVVTFSQAQKELIEDLLEKERRKHPETESFFNDSSDEPPFVKNLENVQGDERDVILFSIGYAPDASGRFSMNFGPLNRQGGERRLNVAITRAREQVVVFSSVHAHQIDLSRSSAAGAAHLKYFLDYAERNFSIAPAGVQDDTSGGMADIVAEYLISNGYRVERNVGCSGCRIALAVRDPDDPAEFLAAVECDDRTYASQNTARDRDNLRWQILKKLGWNLCRVWSAQWAFDRERAQDELIAFLEKHRKGNHPDPGVPPDNGGTPPPADVPETPVETPSLPRSAAESSRCSKYLRWVNKELLLPNAFDTPEASLIIRRQIGEIMDAEAPIFEESLIRRIAEAWDLPRITAAGMKKIRQLIPENLTVSICDGERILWQPGTMTWTYHTFRIPAGDGDKRAIDEIPPEELANAMQELIVDFQSGNKEVLYRETLRLFQLPTLTAKARAHLEHGYAVLQQRGLVPVLSTE